ncbi:MAG: sulfatase-like hydrolase/transferase [Actinomycetota bacterium]
MSKQPDESGRRATNIVVICSDEHNARCFGAAGHPFVQTPNLDALAARGTRFENAWTPSPICVPARASMATGRWVHDLGAWDSAQAYAGETPGWAHAARDAGAHAVSVGKLHFRSEADDFGWTESILPMHIVNGVGWVQGLPRRNPFPYDHAGELAADCAIEESSYTRFDTAVTAKAIEWIDTNATGDRPFALFVSMVAPHYPLAVMEEFVAPYLDLDLPLEIPEQPITHPAIAGLADGMPYHRFFDEDRTRFARQLYLGLCGWLDHNVGQVVAALDRAGVTNDTTIVYTTDHGDMIGNRGLWAKSYMWQDSIRVPMIVAGPDVPVGVDTDTATNLVDLHATIVDTVAAGRAELGAGRSLVELANRPDPQRLNFSEYHDGGSITGSFAVRFGAMKYVHHVGFEPELYDLAVDPDELNDLASDPAHRSDLVEGEAQLRTIVDPDDANARAFASQEWLIEHYGGRDALMNAFHFNHTPVPVD